MLYHSNANNTAPICFKSRITGLQLRVFSNPSQKPFHAHVWVQSVCAVGCLAVVNKELDNHARSVNTGFCTGKLTVIWHLLLRKSQAALGLPQEQLCKTNTRWHKTKHHKQEQLPISACSLQYPMQPPRQKEWIAQTLLPTFRLSTLFLPAPVTWTAEYPTVGCSVWPTGLQLGWDLRH